MTTQRKAYRASILHSVADPKDVGIDESYDYFEDGVLVVENSLSFCSLNSEKPCLVNKLSHALARSVLSSLCLLGWLLRVISPSFTSS